MFLLYVTEMDRYISAEVVKKILEEKGTELEAIVRCYDFPPTIRNVSPLYTMFTHNDTEHIVSYDLFKMYIAIIFFLKVQLDNDGEEKDLKRVEYDLGYAQYHLMKKFEAKEIDETKYEKEVCHAYEKAIIKYLFLIQLIHAKQDKQLNAIKNAVLSMNDETLIKLGYVNRLSNFNKPMTNPTEEIKERLQYYTASSPEASA